MKALRPVLFVSRCLGFEACRWNGEIIRDDFVGKLSGLVDFLHDCPEMGIGLGCPRDPLRVVREGEGTELYQPATGKRFAKEMGEWSKACLAGLPPVDGFILKSRSPSCGWKDVKVYDSFKPESGAKAGAGIFGGAVLERAGGRPVEDEGRLRNFTIREHFLGAVWTLARFREVEGSGDMGALVDFQARHKLFLLLHNQKEMRVMGRIVANLERLPFKEVLSAYRAALLRALASPPKYTSLINVIQHAFGGFSESLSPAERALFVNLVEQYRDERIPASALLRLIYAWALRFGEGYLLEQILFEPYPLELVEISDSGKGRSGR